MHLGFSVTCSKFEKFPSAIQVGFEAADREQRVSNYHPGGNLEPLIKKQSFHLPSRWDLKSLIKSPKIPICHPGGIWSTDQEQRVSICHTGHFKVRHSGNQAPEVNPKAVFRCREPLGAKSEALLSTCAWFHRLPINDQSSQNDQRKGIKSQRYT